VFLLGSIARVRCSCVVVLCSSLGLFLFVVDVVLCFFFCIVWLFMCLRFVLCSSFLCMVVVLVLLLLNLFLVIETVFVIDLLFDPS